jgi:hypothetical protein
MAEPTEKMAEPTEKTSGFPAEPWCDLAYRVIAIRLQAIGVYIDATGRVADKPMLSDVLEIPEAEIPEGIFEILAVEGIRPVRILTPVPAGEAVP